MRAFKTIESDIAYVKQKIEAIERRLKDAPYKKTSDCIGAGIRAFVWAVICPLFSLIAAIKYLLRDANKKTACCFSVFSGIAFFSSAINLFNCYKGKSTIIKSILLRFFSYDDLVKLFIGDSQNLTLDGELYTLEVIITILILVPSTLMFIGSIVKLIRETIKKKACDQSVIDLNKKLEKAYEQRDLFNKELIETKEKAAQMYKEEEQKENPNRKCMESLASLGLNSAEEWLIEDDAKKGKQIFDEEIKKEQPDIAKIKNAADLGYKKACMHYGEYLISDLELYDYTQKEKERIREDAYSKAKPYFKTAAEAGVYDGKLYYIYTRVQTETLYQSDWEEILRNLRMLKNSGELSEKAQETCSECIQTVIDTIERCEKQRRDRISSEANFAEEYYRKKRMQENNSSSSIIEEYYPVVSSGEVDLSGTSPMDWG
ncbi:MAG: hypothetical protein IJJ40_06880 [Clostridia bacterium]|nr:hypothetical protein [Clostridia bacterium]